MKKYVVYNLSNYSIVTLTDERPDLTKLPSSQDFDSVDNWMACDGYCDKIKKFVASKK